MNPPPTIFIVLHRIKLVHSVFLKFIVLLNHTKWIYKIFVIKQSMEESYDFPNDICGQTRFCNVGHTNLSTLGLQYIKVEFCKCRIASDVFIHNVYTKCCVEV
jgi:hypothetical protein